MDVRYYKTSAGFFTIVIDDELYAKCLASPYVIIQNGEIVDGCEDLVHAIQSMPIYTSAFVLDGYTVPYDLYNLWSLIGANVRVVNCDWATISGSNKYFDVIGTDYDRQEAQVRVLATRPNTEVINAYLAIQARLLYFGNEATFHSYLYGNFTADSNTGTVINYTSIGFIVLKEDMSDSRIIQLSARTRDNRITLEKLTQSGVLSNLVNFVNGVKPIDPTDPYSDGGNSDDDEGGDGDFDDSSDTIPDSTPPTISAADTGFTRIYNPTLSQIQALANYLWTDQTVVQTIWNHIKQFLENPMDAFIAFNLVPCPVPDGGTVEFKVMYIGTGINMTKAANQFVDVDCGTLAITKHYDSALDYSPYTKVSLFLPFIGHVYLDTDDVMGKTLRVKYRIDIVSGACVAKVFVNNSVHYQYSGHCAINIPFTSADFTGYISAIIQAGKSVTSITAGAAGAGALATSLAGLPSPKTGESTVTYTQQQLNPDTGRMRTTNKNTVTESSNTKASFDSIVGANVSNTVGAVMSSKFNVERSGSFSGNSGYLGIRRPFAIIEIPRMCNPDEYGKFNGRPSMKTRKLSECSGFTQIQQVQLTGISATNPELDEIYSLLKGGVIL